MPTSQQHITFGLIRISTLPFFYFLFYFPMVSISQSLIYTTPFKKISTPSQPFTSTYFFFFRLLNLRFFHHSSFPVHTFSFFYLSLVFLNQFTQHLDWVEAGKQDKERKRRRFCTSFFWIMAFWQFCPIRLKLARISPIQRASAQVSPRRGKKNWTWHRRAGSSIPHASPRVRQAFCRVRASQILGSKWEF